MADKRVSSDQPGGISSDVIDKPRWHFGDFMYGLYIYFRVGTTSAPQTYLYVDYTNSLVQKQILKSMILATELQSYDRNKVCRVVCISDTHERHSSIIVPPCDILVHSGDIVFVGRKQSPDLLCSKMKSFDTWLSSTPSALRIVVPGNHDNILESLNETQRQTLLPSATLLNNTRVNYKGLVLFGSPYSTGHSRNRAFQDPEIYDDAIVKMREQGDIDILITHSNDITPRHALPPFEIGAEKKVEKARKYPVLHIWGHHHTNYGAHICNIYNDNDVNNLMASNDGTNPDRTNAGVEYGWNIGLNTAVKSDTPQSNPGAYMSINASIMNAYYSPCNPPVVFDVPLPIDTTAS